MAGIPISARQTVRVALVFAALILGFGILSIIIGWPDKQSWGLVAILSLGIAALPLLGPILAFLRDSGTVVDIKGVKLDFSKSPARGVPVERTNFQDDPGMPVGDSDAASVAEAAEAAKSAAIVVIDLGTGRSWYPTRLFTLAAAAQELQGARALVLLAQREGVPGRFVGWIRPEDAVAAFCQSDRRYRLALNHARTVLSHLKLSGGFENYAFPVEYQADANNVLRAYRETGDLAFVPALISRLQSQPVDPNPNPDPPAVGPLEFTAEPVWLSREAAERLLDPWLIREHVHDDMPDDDKKAALCRSAGDFLALTENNGGYRGMIDIAAMVRSAVFCPANAKA